MRFESSGALGSLVPTLCCAHFPRGIMLHHRQLRMIFSHGIWEQFSHGGGDERNWEEIQEGLGLIA